MKKRNSINIILLFMGIMMASCGKKQAQVVEEVQVPNVRLHEVGTKLVEQNYELTATVQPEYKNSIAPATPGRIRSILVKVGQQVSKGQKLVQMDVVNLSNTETQIANMRRSYNRISELYKVGGASQQDLDNAKLQLDLAEANAQTQSENTYLISPISGVVTAKNYDNGDMYSGQMPVVVVMSINPVKLMVNVSESFYDQVRLGMPITVSLDVFEGKKFDGKVSLIYPTIDERSRTFSVEIKLNNNNNKIRPGMFARATMKFGTKKRVVVPDMSIVKQNGSGSKYVFIYTEGKVKMQELSLGRRVASDYEVLSGLSGGEQIVIAGQSKLVDGSKVNVIK